MSRNEDRDRAARVLRARIAAYEKHARYPAAESTTAARAAFEANFIKAVDPDRALPEDERLRRVAAKRKAHFTRLAYLSAQARRRGKQ